MNVAAFLCYLLAAAVFATHLADPTAVSNTFGFLLGALGLALERLGDAWRQ